MNSSGSLVCSFLLLHPPVTPRKTAAAALWPCKHSSTCLASPCIVLPCLALLCLPPVDCLQGHISLLVSACLSEAGGMGMLRCYHSSPFELPPSNWYTTKVLAIDSMWLVLAGEKAWFKPRNKVLSPPAAAAAKQHFDREAGRSREGYHTLLWQHKDPVCCSILEIFSPPSDAVIVEQYSGVFFFHAGGWIGHICSHKQHDCFTWTVHHFLRKPG